MYCNYSLCATDGLTPASPGPSRTRSDLQYSTRPSTASFNRGDETQDTENSSSDPIRSPHRSRPGQLRKADLPVLPVTLPQEWPNTLPPSDNLPSQTPLPLPSPSTKPLTSPHSPPRPRPFPFSALSHMCRSSTFLYLVSLVSLRRSLRHLSPALPSVKNGQQDVETSSRQSYTRWVFFVSPHHRDSGVSETTKGHPLRLRVPPLHYCTSCLAGRDLPG